jgi:hypothetical protein
MEIYFHIVLEVRKSKLEALEFDLVRIFFPL